MTLDLARDEFDITAPDSLWAGRSLYDLYAEAHTPRDWHAPIFKRCRELGLACFSTPFSPAAVDFLEELKIPAYKVASFENTDLELIRRIAATGKPMIISTGMATLAELDAVEIEGHLVGGVGLQFQGRGPGPGRSGYQFQGFFERAVVVAGHFGDDVGGLVAADFAVADGDAGSSGHDALLRGNCSEIFQSLFAGVFSAGPRSR
jgi:hypothetical protein